MPDAQFCVRYRRWMPLWAAVAVVNMGIGVYLASDPVRANDFEILRYWTDAWLLDGRDLYRSAESGTDYPPHAILVLSAISLLPRDVAIPVWAALNLVLAGLAALLAARFVRPGVSWRDAACLAVLFLGWSGTKTLLQFTLVVLVFGLASLVLADRRRGWSAVCLGLALMKPQVGLPFLLWAIFTRRWSVVGGAVATVAAGSLLWCARAGANPFDVAVRYLEILRVYYAGQGALVGISKLAPLLERVLPADVAGSLAVGILLAMLAVICREGWTYGHVLDRHLYPAPALAGAWSLLLFYHLTYGFVVLLPAAALLMLAADPATATLRYRVLWVMQIGLAIDVPGLWRRAGAWFSPPPVVDAFAQDFYRWFLLGLLLTLFIVHRASAPGRQRAGGGPRTSIAR